MARKLLLGLSLLAVVTCTVQGQSPQPQWRPASGVGLPAQSGRPVVNTASPAAVPVPATAPIATSAAPTLPGQSWQAPPPPVVYPQPGRPAEPRPLNVTQPVQHILPPPPGAGPIPRPGPQAANPVPPGPISPDLMPVPVAPIPPMPPILPVQAQVKDKEKESEITVDIPGRERIFGHLDTERVWQERLRQEYRDRREPDQARAFPDDVVLTREPYAGRNWPRQHTYVEPNFLVYRRLYFEDPNSERFGWDLGPLSPVVSTLYFYRDTLLFPYRCGSDFWRRYETNAGRCLPGDPVPYLIYPIGVSATGTATSTATLLILLAAFP